MNKFKQALYRFMAGRYGPDQLNMAMLWVSLGLMILGRILGRFPLLSAVLGLISMVLLIIAAWRPMSRSTNKRYEENRRFLRWKQQLTDRQHRYFRCPRCRCTTRVPRDKGKIAITCPRCRERFIKKT